MPVTGRIHDTHCGTCYLNLIQIFDVLFVRKNVTEGLTHMCILHNDNNVTKCIVQFNYSKSHFLVDLLYCIFIIEMCKNKSQ